MVMRNVVRTPRKEKVWAVTRSLDTPNITLTTGGVEVASDLLASLKTDMGITRPPRSTVMRIFGTIDGANLASATASSQVIVHYGIAWVRSDVANAGFNDAQIPDPGEPGLIQVPWIHRGTVFGQSVAGVNPPWIFAQGNPRGSATIDVTQMRKQPTQDYELVLITRTSSIAATDPALYLNLSVMLALA